VIACGVLDRKRHHGHDKQHKAKHHKAKHHKAKHHKAKHHGHA
jgi:hypothetical protein